VLKKRRCSPLRSGTNLAHPAVTYCNPASFITPSVLPAGLEPCGFLKSAGHVRARLLTNGHATLQCCIMAGADPGTSDCSLGRFVATTRCGPSAMHSDRRCTVGTWQWGPAEEHTHGAERLHIRPAWPLLPLNNGDVPSTNISSGMAMERLLDCDTRIASIGQSIALHVASSLRAMHLHRAILIPRGDLLSLSISRTHLEI
jgi:hypothetical protein